MCEHCVKHVEDALKTIAKNYQVSLEDNKAIVFDAKIDDEDIKKVIEEAGYEVTGIANE